MLKSPGSSALGLGLTQSNSAFCSAQLPAALVSVGAEAGMAFPLFKFFPMALLEKFPGCSGWPVSPATPVKLWLPFVMPHFIGRSRTVLPRDRADSASLVGCFEAGKCLCDGSPIDLPQLSQRTSPAGPGYDLPAFFEFELLALPLCRASSVNRTTPLPSILTSVLYIAHVNFP